MTRAINTRVLAALVRQQVRPYKNLRLAAADAGVSPATLSRVQRGHAPDTDALAALVRWLRVPVDRVLTNPPVVDQPAPTAPTVEKVAVHLRADPNLSPETATALTEMFRVMYDRFADRDRRERAATA